MAFFIISIALAMLILILLTFTVYMYIKLVIAVSTYTEVPNWMYKIGQAFKSKRILQNLRHYWIPIFLSFFLF